MKTIGVISDRIGQDVALYKIKRGEFFQPFMEEKVYVKSRHDRFHVMPGLNYFICQPLDGGMAQSFHYSDRVFRRDDLCVAPIKRVK